MTRQLPLSVQLKQDISFDTFVAGRNGETLSALLEFLADGGGPFLYLWGSPGVGKTHLLQAACRQARTEGKDVAYLPLSQVDELDPGIMQNLDLLELNCLDDIQCICGLAHWENALFTLFNRLREQGGRLVTSADAPPSGLPIALPDLKSRLTWGPTYRVQDLDDEDRLRLLVQSARRRGLELSPDTGWYLLRRCPRDNHSLQGLLDHLDRYSMATQRRLTIPLVREALESIAESDSDP